MSRLLIALLVTGTLMVANSADACCRRRICRPVRVHCTQRHTARTCCPTPCSEKPQCEACESYQMESSYSDPEFLDLQDKYRDLRKDFDALKGEVNTLRSELEQLKSVRNER